MACVSDFILFGDVIIDWVTGEWQGPSYQVPKLNLLFCLSLTFPIYPLVLFINATHLLLRLNFLTWTHIPLLHSPCYSKDTIVSTRHLHLHSHFIINNFTSYQSDWILISKQESDYVTSTFHIDPQLMYGLGDIN